MATCVTDLIMNFVFLSAAFSLTYLAGRKRTPILIIPSLLLSGLSIISMFCAQSYREIYARADEVACWALDKKIEKIYKFDVFPKRTTFIRFTTTDGNEYVYHFNSQTLERIDKETVVIEK